MAGNSSGIAAHPCLSQHTAQKFWCCKCCSGQWQERCGQKRFWQLPMHDERVNVGLLPALVQRGQLGVFKNCLDTILCPVL